MKFYVGLSYVQFLSTLAYTVSTLSYVHFLIDLILCTLSYKSMWVTWDYLMYNFLLTSSYSSILSYVHSLIHFIVFTLSYKSMCVTWDYLMYIFLLTSSYSRHLMNIFLLHWIILYTFSYGPHLMPPS